MCYDKATLRFKTFQLIVSANSLLWALLREMWVSADLVSRLRLWQGPAGDRREQRGIARSAGEEGQAVSSCPSVPLLLN